MPGNDLRRWQWTQLLLGGVAAAIVGFVLQAVIWPAVSHRVADTETVSVVARLSPEAVIEVFVANDSDETVDLLSAEIAVVTNIEIAPRGAAVPLSHVYEVEKAQVARQRQGEMRLDLLFSIAHSLPPGARDRFAFRLRDTDPASIVVVEGQLLDEKERQFVVEFRP